MPNVTCVGCFQAHSGATEVLTFLDEGRLLLSASADHTVKGHSVRVRNRSVECNLAYALIPFMLFCFKVIHFSYFWCLVH